MASGTTTYFHTGQYAGLLSHNSFYLPRHHVNSFSTTIPQINYFSQGVVGFYDARDLNACDGICSWSPRAGFLGPLSGSATISGDGWVMNPRMVSARTTGITGSQAYTSIVGFNLSSGAGAAQRMLVQIGGSGQYQCRAQLLSADNLRFSGCGDDHDPENIVITPTQQTASSHLWAVMHDSGNLARSYWNGRHETHTTTSTWNTVDSPLFVGRSVTGPSDLMLQGGIRFVLLLNRALTQSEVAAVARWSWESHRVGLDLMNFSPEAWTGVSAGQVYWTPLSHMQPLSSRTVRFFISISETNPIDRCVLRFGKENFDDPNTALDRMISVYITKNTKQMLLDMTNSGLNGVLVYECPSDLSAPSFVTLVYTQTSMSTFINSVKQTHSQCSPSSTPAMADTDATRKARVSSNFPSTGFTLRSLQLLDYAMPDLEAQAPVIISVTPQVLLASNSSVTVIGSPFVAGAACSALFLDGSTSTNCTAVSAVEIVIWVSISVPTTRPSMLMVVVHSGITFRAPIACVWPFFVADSTGSCQLHKAIQGSGAALSLSSYLANTTSVVLTVSFLVAPALNTTALKLISLTGLRFSALNATAAPASCSNFNPRNVGVSAGFTPSAGVLLLNLSASATAALPTAAIVCKVAGFMNSDAAAAAAPVSVSTLDAGGLMLQSQGGVEFPAIFPHLGSGGALSLSSYLANTTGVVLTVSFSMVPALNTTALKLISLTGLRFSALNATAASASCSNLNPPNVGVSAAFTPSAGVLLLNLSASATAALPTAAIVCKVAGLTNAAATANPFFSGGDGFIQIGDWRFGRTGDDHHFSFSHRVGRTILILRSDGAYHLGNGRTDWGHWHLPISWTSPLTSSIYNVYDLENLPNVLFGTSWIDFGPNIRLGTYDNVHLCVSFRQTCCQNYWGHSSFGIHTSGIVAHKYFL
jgi:hypothetical protein